MGYKVSIASILKLAYTQIEIFSNSSNKYAKLFKITFIIQIIIYSGN